MPLLSAVEDFVQRSLSALPTVWEKLHFVQGLREPDGRYRHWGLERTFDAQTAGAAIAEAHNALCEELASTRLAELWLGASQAALREQQEVAEFLKSMDSAGAVPMELRGVAPEHVRFVVANLSRVARFRSTSNRSAA